MGVSETSEGMRLNVCPVCQGEIKEDLVVHCNSCSTYYHLDPCGFVLFERADPCWICQKRALDVSEVRVAQEKRQLLPNVQGTVVAQPGSIRLPEQARNAQGNAEQRTGKTGNEGLLLFVGRHRVEVGTQIVILGREKSLDSLLEVEESGGIGVGIDLPPNVEIVQGITFVRLPDSKRYVDPAHAELFFKNGRWWVRDLGSINGTAFLATRGWVEVSKKSELPKSGVVALGYGPTKGPYLIVSYVVS